MPNENFCSDLKEGKFKRLNKSNIKNSPGRPINYFNMEVTTVNFLNPE
jgi:hypothetical protein